VRSVMPYTARGEQRRRGVPGETVPVSLSYSKKKVTVTAGRKYAKQRVELFAEDQYLLTTVIGGNGESSIRVKTRQGAAIVDAMEDGVKITAKIVE